MTNFKLHKQYCIVDHVEYYIIDLETQTNHKINMDDLGSFEYCIRDRSDLIDDLIWYIAESKNIFDKTEMKKDLKMLMNLEDDYIFSSNNTNEYIARTNNKEVFNAICKDILAL